MNKGLDKEFIEGVKRAMAMNPVLIQCVEMAIDCNYAITPEAYAEYLKEIQEVKKVKETTTIITAELTFISKKDMKINEKQLATNIEYMTGADDVHIVNVQEFILEKDLETRIKELEEKVEKATSLMNRLLGNGGRK